MISLIDDWTDVSLIDRAIKSWPSCEWNGWHCYENGKKASKPGFRIPAACQTLIDRISDIDLGELFPDRGLHGAGLHQMEAGRKLGLHLDTERHPLYSWKREYSAILYLDNCEGGELEFTDPSGKTLCSVVPCHNRIVLFATPSQWHRVRVTKSIRRALCVFFWSECQEVAGMASRAKFVEQNSNQNNESGTCTTALQTVPEK